MGWWRLAREVEINARLASMSDRTAISTLLANAWWRHGTPALDDQVALLQSGASAIAFKHDQCVGWMGFTVRQPTVDPPERWAEAASLAVAGGRSPLRALQALLQTVLPVLQAWGVTALVCMTRDDWLRNALFEMGFHEHDRVMGYVRSGNLLPPDRQAGPAEVRAARAQDGETVLALNSAAFSPIWRYDSSTILSWLLTADHAVLAETEVGPAGFALTNGPHHGELAQLVRIATHPDFQGRGIGRQLVVDAIHYAWSANAGGLSLNTQTGNTTSRRLYEKLGFRPTGQIVSVLVRETSPGGSV